MPAKTYLPSDVNPVVQKRIQQTFKPLTDDISTGELVLQGIELVSSQINLVNHGLGRNYRGFEVHSTDQAVFIWEDTSSDADQSLYIPLLCSTDCTVDLKVY